MTAATKLEPAADVFSLSEEKLSIQSLQASQEITLQLERSKATTETIIDELPDVLMIIERDGTIIRSNEGVAKLFGVDIEGAVSMRCTALFGSESANIFEGNLAAVAADTGRQKSAEFELNVDGAGDAPREFLWVIRSFTAGSSRTRQLFCVLGRDVSQMRAYQKQVSSIFSNIPLGLVCINRLGRVEGPYSAYTEHLLNRQSCDDVDIESLIFDRGWESLTPAEKEGAKQIILALGADEIWYNAIKAIFPTEICHPGDDALGVPTRWLGLSYFPVVQHDIVEKMLLIIEDRTQLVQARMEADRKKRSDDHMLERLNEVQCCTPEVLRASIGDLQVFFERLDEEMGAKDYTAVMNTIHAIKSVVRVAGFTQLKAMANELEEAVLPMLKNGQTMAEGRVMRQVDSMLTEWRNVEVLVHAALGEGAADRLTQKYRRADDRQARKKRLLELASRALQGQTADAGARDALLSEIKALDAVPLLSLEARLRNLSQRTATELDKMINVVFAWDDVECQEDALASLGEILLHLVNNAIDHGIETPEQRSKCGKDQTGTIQITAVRHGEVIDIEIQDDGSGINVDAVKESAVGKGFISRDESLRLSESDALRLLFRQGFSTASSVTEISGRGIGLDAVERAVRQLHGDGIAVATIRGKGTTFSFSIRPGEA